MSNDRRRDHHAAAWKALYREFVDSGLRSLTPAEVAVYAIVLRETRSDGMARVSRDDLARRSGRDARSVSRALSSLIGRGALIRLKPGAARLLPVYTPFSRETLDADYPRAARWLPDDAVQGDAGVPHPRAEG